VRKIASRRWRDVECTHAGSCGPGYLALFAAILLHAAALQAHDFWIEPATFHPAWRDRRDHAARRTERRGEAVPRWSGGIAAFFVRQQPRRTDQRARAHRSGRWLHADGQATAVIALSQPSVVHRDGGRAV